MRSNRDRRSKWSSQCYAITPPELKSGFSLAYEGQVIKYTLGINIRIKRLEELLFWASLRWKVLTSSCLSKFLRPTKSPEARLNTATLNPSIRQHFSSEHLAGLLWLPNATKVWGLDYASRRVDSFCSHFTKPRFYLRRAGLQIYRFSIGYTIHCLCPFK